MRAIMSCLTSLTRNYLPNYGNNWVIAPNFQRLEKHCVTFDHFYGGSMPCMPAGVSAYRKAEFSSPQLGTAGTL